MMLKIAYLGEKFHGFAHQPGLRTVEGDIVKALNRIGLTSRVYPASRTDKGVSALCNVVRVDIKREDICRILTSLLKDIWVYGYNLSDWNPRHSMKHYIYFLPGNYSEEKLQECCTLFSGVHDFSAFTKGKYLNTVKEITVSFHVTEDVILFHFTGRSFLWEMIRRCVTGMKEYLSGAQTEQDILTMLEGRSKKMPAASPENLLLADLNYEFSFLSDEFSTQRMRKEFISHYELHSVKKAMFKQLCTP